MDPTTPLTQEVDPIPETEKGAEAQPRDPIHHNKGDPDRTRRKNLAIAAAIAQAATKKQG